MQPLRNSVRYYNFKAALKKYNKGAAFVVTPRYYNILLTIYLLAHYRRSQVFSSIYKTLDEKGMYLRWKHLLDCLTILINAGYIIKVGSAYQLTASATTLLMDMERRLKNERFDK